MNEGIKVYPHLFPEIETWPIYKLSQRRPAFVAEITQSVYDRLSNKSMQDLADVLAKTAYLETVRLKEDPWKVDPINEASYWKKLQNRLADVAVISDEVEKRSAYLDLLKNVTGRYTEEIVGYFDKKTFLFMRRSLTWFFNRLLNSIAIGKGRARKRILQKLLVKGEVETARSLMKEGVLVIVPTHFSNLDSPLVGYAIDTFTGMPSFSYGAGLNLFNFGFAAYFMNRLGAYKIDRRKKNPIYLEVLKTMSTLSLSQGVNTIFFPGGTRSRSGALEEKLKLGLLGTVIEAQRLIFQQGKTTKIFIAPLILSYHFVLEAQPLVDNYLRKLDKKKYRQFRKKGLALWDMLKFIWYLFSKSNEIVLSFGKPMDVVGNLVDAHGNSYDQYGNLIHLQEYFYKDGVVSLDLQRESEYTKMFSRQIVDRFHKDNIVLSSHVMAFAAFEFLKNRNPKLDLYGILRLTPREFTFPSVQLANVVQQLLDRLKVMEQNGEIKLMENLWSGVQEVMEDGIEKLGTYHFLKPLRFKRKGDIVSDNFHLLYYYHNRLENYGLDKVIQMGG